MPLIAAYQTGEIRLNSRKNHRPHSLIKKRIIFSKVDYIELNNLIFRCVLNREIKPKCVTFRINIVLYNQIVLLFTHPMG